MSVKDRLRSSLGMILVGGLCLMAGSAQAQTMAPIYDGGDLDYQPAPLRLANGDLLVVIERLSARTNSGNLYVTRSRDGGTTWEVPHAIIATGLNERHPSVVQLPDGGFVLFYLVDEGGGVYRIHRAISRDGDSWSRQGAVDLGWGLGKELNPSVICEADGSLTMTYQRVNGASYIARSTDGGTTWDKLQTQVSDGWAALPRVTRRELDGLYVVTYQVDAGNWTLALQSKASYDPYDWRRPVSVVSSGANSHDSQPLALEDGSFLVTYIEQSGSDAFDLYARTSLNGVTWSSASRLTTTTTRYDIQPHPILQGTPGFVSLFWSYQDGATPYSNHDIWMMKDLPVGSSRRLSSLQGEGF